MNLPQQILKAPSVKSLTGLGSFSKSVGAPQFKVPIPLGNRTPPPSSGKVGIGHPAQSIDYTPPEGQNLSLIGAIERQVLGTGPLKPTVETKISDFLKQPEPLDQPPRSLAGPAGDPSVELSLKEQQSLLGLKPFQPSYVPFPAYKNLNQFIDYGSRAKWKNPQEPLPEAVRQPTAASKYWGTLQPWTLQKERLNTPDDVRSYMGQQIQPIRMPHAPVKPSWLSELMRTEDGIPT